MHALVFEVGFYFRSLTTTKPIIKEALVLFETPVSRHKVHMSFRYLFLESHQTTYHSNIGDLNKNSNQTRVVYLKDHKNWEQFSNLKYIAI